MLERLKAKQLKRIYSETKFTSAIDNLAIGRSDYPLKAMIAEMIFVLLRFGGFWCCLNALSIHSSISFLEWLAAFCLAWTIGLVIPAAPGGVGVFEAALFLRIGNLVPEAPLLMTLLCYRLIATMADLITALGVFVRHSFVSLVAVKQLR